MPACAGAKKRELPLLHALRFHQEIRRGSSLPLLLGGDDGQTYVVKLNAAGDGLLARVIEWLAGRLGEVLEVPVLPPVAIWVSAGLAGQAADPEIKELLAKSEGLNLATIFLPEASPFRAEAAAGLDDAVQQRLFLFDLLLLNLDRTGSNPNLIVHAGRLWSLDYSSAFEIRSLLTGAAYREHVILKQLKRHPFYRPETSAHGFLGQLRDISEDRLRAIASSLPSEWLAPLQLAPSAAAARTALTHKLIRLQQLGLAKLARRLDLLKVLVLESEEEMNARNLQNRKAFESRWG